MPPLVPDFLQKYEKIKKIKKMLVALHKAKYTILQSLSKIIH